MSRDVVCNEKEMTNLVKYKPSDLRSLYDIDLELEVESTNERHPGETNDEPVEEYQYQELQETATRDTES